MKVDDTVDFDDDYFDISDLLESGDPLDYDDPYFNYRDQIRGNHIRRTNCISDILDSYRTQQCVRERVRRRQRKVVLYSLLGIIAVLLSVTIALFVWASKKSEFRVADAATVITSILAIITAILSIIHTIVKYLFPTDEDKNFNDLVVKIIEGDTSQLINDKNFLTKKDEDDNQKNIQ